MRDTCHFPHIPHLYLRESQTDMAMADPSARIVDDRPRNRNGNHAIERVA